MSKRGTPFPALPCRACGKMVRYRSHDADPRREHNRYTHRHKCGHGKWCRAGDRLHGRAHVNHCCVAPLAAHFRSHEGGDA